MAEGRNPDGTFAKGSEGGPGRGKSPRRIEGLLRKLGEEIVPDANGLPITRLQRLMDKVYDLAEEGQQWAVTFVAERTEGKIRETQMDTPDEATPIKIIDLDTVKAESD